MQINAITGEIIDASIKVHRHLDVGYRIDLFVEDEVIVELKAVEKLILLYDAQLLSYLKLKNRKQIDSDAIASLWVNKNASIL